MSIKDIFPDIHIEPEMADKIVKAIRHHDEQSSELQYKTFDIHYLISVNAVYCVLLADIMVRLNKLEGKDGL